jgi:hypothetical protein
MRRILISALAALLLALASFGSALGHVHGITPLNADACDAPPANANAGGNGTNGTPADDANDGPIAGVIPFGTGNAEAGNLDNGEGGRNSALCD